MANNYLIYGLMFLAMMGVVSAIDVSTCGTYSDNNVHYDQTNDLMTTLQRCVDITGTNVTYDGHNYKLWGKAPLGCLAGCLNLQGENIVAYNLNSNNTNGAEYSIVGTYPKNITIRNFIANRLISIQGVANFILQDGYSPQVYLTNYIYNSTVLNVTGYSIETLGSLSTLILNRSWYVQQQINSSAGEPLYLANIKNYDKNNQLSSPAISNQNGYARYILNQYNYSNKMLNYFNNYTINTSHSDFDSCTSQNVNISGNVLNGQSICSNPVQWTLKFRYMSNSFTVPSSTFHIRLMANNTILIGSDNAIRWKTLISDLTRMLRLSSASP